MKDKQIIVLAIVLLIFAITFFWWHRNQRGTRNRGTNTYKGPNSNSRASDLKLLSHQEQLIQKQAKKMISKGQVIQAAHMLEQIGLHREAIETLERANHIDDAARILLRMQKPARAAAIYARHRMMREAAQCFISAGQLLDAAACLKEAKQYREAAELFAKENNLENAAECFQAGQYFLDAARCWIKANRKEMALQCWFEICKSPTPLADFSPSNEEQEMLFRALKSGANQPQIEALLGASSKITSMILEALNENKRDLAARLFAKAPEYTAGQLISEINVQSPEARSMAEIFQDAGQHRFAAMLFEQCGDFRSAAISFEKAGDQDRANYCLERIGLKPKSTDIKISATPITPASRSPSEAARGSFFIETGAIKIDVPPTDESPAQDSAPTMNTENELGGKNPLSTDEDLLLRRDWLLYGCNQEEQDSVINLFQTLDVEAGSSVISGSEDTFLVMVSSGTMKTPDNKTAGGGDWLAPELALAGGDRVTWVAQSPARILIIRVFEFDQLLSQNAELTRIVYTNLTQHLLHMSRNPSKNIAI